MNALSIPGAVNKSNGRPLSLCFEHRFELGESGRIPPSFLRSARGSMPPIPSNWIYVQTHSGRGRRTDRERLRLLLPPEICQVDFEHPGSLDGRRRDMSTVPQGSRRRRCRRGSCFWLPLLSEGGRGANTHTGYIFYSVPAECPGEKLPNV